MTQAVLQTMVTVVDSPEFSELYQSKHDIADRPDLCQEEGEEAEVPPRHMKRQKCPPNI